MIGTIQKILEKLGKSINNHIYIALAILIALTVLAGIGITKIEFQSDLSEMDPQDLQIVIQSNRVSDQFFTGDATLILIQLTPDEKSDITDIRDPKVITFISTLKQNLAKENLINQITSPSDVFFSGLPETLEESKSTISKTPGANNFFGQAYDWTIILIESDVGNDESKIEELNQVIEETILESGKPSGIKTTVTGTPSLIALMFNFLINDSRFTLSAAAILIFLLLMIIERSIKKSIRIMLPLLFGLAWTLGTLGWLNIPITIATAGLSAMLLGLGVEYSIFLFSRYEEERVKTNSKEAIVKALSTTGASTVSSGATTLIGFGALTLSAFPVLQDMGSSLAIGIGLILFSVMFTSPTLILLEDKFLKPQEQKGTKRKRKPLKAIFKKYGQILSRFPIIIITISIILTASMFVGISLMQNQEIDFDTVLPSNLPELDAFKTIQNERGQTESIILYIEIIPSEYSSLKDIREKNVAEYINLITQKSENLAYIESISSYTKTEKMFNDGKLFSSFADRREFYNEKNLETSNLITPDYSATIITLDFHEDVKFERPEVVRQTKELIKNTPSPEGIKVTLVGELAVQQELNSIQGPDSGKTAIIAMIGVFFLLLILSRSIKYTILPLFTVVGAIIWTLGLVGFTKTPFNSITSSVLSMTIGIGIDFGLQLSMRYRQERQTSPKKEAMTQTLTHTLYPMTITVIAALIGFRAMSLGNLTMMADLGTTMGYSIIASMAVAVTLVAALILIFDRSKESNNSQHKQKSSDSKQATGKRKIYNFSTNKSKEISTSKLKKNPNLKKSRGKNLRS